MVLNWSLKSEKALVLQMVSPLVLTFSLFLMTAIATHLVMSFGQTLLHYKVAHHRIGGRLFRNHINFHHTHYADDHLVSRRYLGDEGNITPYFFIPLFLVGGVRLFPFAAKSFCGDDSCKCGVVLRARLFRQGISRRGIAASKVCVVQTPARNYTLFITVTRIVILV